eukprot:CAMPEP_0115456142 /NCGR_PEP_ID=MMETSP0271-20121206/44530_1 /TAXON_ID=71861 /ORGANISM="Scrippsiella trochoidea, Strain CCMP3099" /LENGTH=574 /DNA_ID=CAMNT_0002882637 /DNA_START=41 /DNA_END=1765 /DNA_ORIENTATION=-
MAWLRMALVCLPLSLAEDVLPQLLSIVETRHADAFLSDAPPDEIRASRKGQPSGRMAVLDETTLLSDLEATHLQEQAARSLIEGACFASYDHVYRVFKDSTCQKADLPGCKADGVHEACRYCGPPASGQGVAYPACPRAFVNVPLFHLAAGAAYRGFGVFIEAKLGSPAKDAQYITLLLDSASSSLGIIGRETVGHPGPLPQCTMRSFHTLGARSHCGLGSYTVHASRSAERWPHLGDQYCPTVDNDTDGRPYCVLRAAYADGSGFSAMMVRDALSIGSYTQPVPVNAIYRMSGPFQEPPCSGILGVAAARLNCVRLWDPETCFPGAMEQLLTSQGLRNKLGLCLGRPPQPEHAGSERLDHGTPGLLSLGGSAPELTVGSPHYSKIVSTRGYMTVRLLGVGVNGQLAPVRSAYFRRGILVDTGATVLSLPQAAWEAIAHTGSKHKCFSDRECLLNIQLQEVCLKLVDMVGCHAKRRTCSNISKRFLASGPPMLGFAALKDLYLELDIQSRQVGFATRSEAACNTECSAFLTEITCSFAKGCSWTADRCSGGMSTGGSTSRGSIATAEDKCFGTS